MPEVFANIWRDFRSLDSSRDSNGYGANPIKFSEILAYCTLCKTELALWELEVLKIFDIALINLQVEQRQKEQKK